MADNDSNVLQSEAEAADFLRSLLNKNLRVTTTDGRMFWGSLKCTDPESNIVIQNTYEYRRPSLQSLQKQTAEAAAAAAVGESTTPTPAPAPEPGATAATLKMDMTSRYLGLVVVPGRHIVKIEVEEFASQMKNSAAVERAESPL
ncbi:hypothetical protein B0T17DRAFT_509637 [Bombardia bombarda]|uniref:Sm domain-containing protein n=1 Tax=Bombardia bombarda TaxID=252184 RepID=A0AA39WMD6_9PEZI|nr:hypothetical protein B0T17DRAFT_509637 [Bombardia bombarda]